MKREPFWTTVLLFATLLSGCCTSGKTLWLSLRPASRIAPNRIFNYAFNKGDILLPPDVFVIFHHHEDESVHPNAVELYRKGERVALTRYVKENAKHPFGCPHTETTFAAHDLSPGRYELVHRKARGTGKPIWLEGGKVRWSTFENETALVWMIRVKPVPRKLRAWTHFHKTPNGLNGIWGSGNQLFAVGKGGTILRSIDEKFELMQSKTNKILRAVWGSGPDNVFAVGADGVIVHYREGKWTLVASGTTPNLRAIWGSSKHRRSCARMRNRSTGCT